MTTALLAQPDAAVARPRKQRFGDPQHLFASWLELPSGRGLRFSHAMRVANTC